MIYKRGHVYWYKFSFGGQSIRQSTRQGNDKVARNMESAHRARLAGQSKERDAARERLQCAEALTCHECEALQCREGRQEGYKCILYGEVRRTVGQGAFDANIARFPRRSLYAGR